LFKRKLTTKASTEILFFITPHIYRPDYQGRPTTGAVSSGPRSVTIPQPVQLGNPPSNTPTPTQLQQPTPQTTTPGTHNAAIILVKSGLCGGLFGNVDPVQLINSYRDPQKLYITQLLSQGQAVPSVGATTYRDGRIAINSEGAYLTGKTQLTNAETGAPMGVASAYEIGLFKGLSRPELRAVVIIHELLHAIGAHPRDRDDAQNSANTARIINRCINLVPRPFAPAVTTTPNPSGVTPTIRPLRGGVGGGGGGEGGSIVFGVTDTFDEFRWLELLLRPRGRGSLGRV
jgi:hypothetical protein